MTDIIDSIDAAIGCQQCGHPIGDSVSDDFCSQGCQGDWHSNPVRSEPLPFPPDLHFQGSGPDRHVTVADTIYNQQCRFWADSDWSAWTQAPMTTPAEFPVPPELTVPRHVEVPDVTQRWSVDPISDSAPILFKYAKCFVCGHVEMTTHDVPWNSQHYHFDNNNVVALIQWVNW